jgi:formiminotetrahydrofolate cyclodeaminase
MNGPVMAGHTVHGGYLDLTLGQFLDQIAARQAAPGAGATAALAVAMAAGLVTMAARYSGDRLEHAEDVITRAETLRLRVAPLAQADAGAYQQVIEARALTNEPDPKARESRRQAIRRALEGAADVPLKIAEIGADVAELAATVVERGNPNLRGDGVTAGLLAASGARSTAMLVGINVGDRDERALQAARFAETATAAARRAVDIMRPGFGPSARRTPPRSARPAP